MSFPNSFAAFKAARSKMSSNSVASTASPVNYGETFLATIGTDVVPVPIQTIASINDAAYLKMRPYKAYLKLLTAFLVLTVSTML